jgi:hypothetical protein
MLVEQVVDVCDTRVERGEDRMGEGGAIELQRGINIKACVASPSPGEEHPNAIGLVFQGEDNNLTLIPHYLYCETACILTCPENWEK